jgi:hypothetical protein
LPSLIDEINAGHLGIAARTVRLPEVETEWRKGDGPGVRTVIVP